MIRMGRTVRPNGRPVNGHNVAEFNEAVFAEYGRTCHLCGRPGADTSDHLIPTSVDPSLRWDIANARPAHRECNSERGDSAVPAAWSAAGW
jgi:5-methylcytosine-specific restriction endonuclease McrA